jgi:hypothetical protein
VKRRVAVATPKPTSSVGGSFPNSIESVADDQAVLVVLLDRPHHVLDNSLMHLWFRFCRFIEQVEADLAAEDALKALSEPSPVLCADVLGLGVGPE